MNILSLFDVKKLEKDKLLYLFNFLNSIVNTMAFIFDFIKYSQNGITFHQTNIIGEKK